MLTSTPFKAEGGWAIDTRTPETKGISPRYSTLGTGSAYGVETQHAPYHYRESEFVEAAASDSESLFRCCCVVNFSKKPFVTALLKVFHACNAFGPKKPISRSDLIAQQVRIAP